MPSPLVLARTFLFAALLFSQTGCASTGNDSADSSTPDSSSSDYNQPKNDNSNGWGTGFKVGH